MSAHPAPTEIFELQRTGSLTQARATGPNYVVEDDDAATDSDVDNQTQEQSDFEDEDIDDSVKEDMRKLEDSFPGISDRFRLVNRIGEGNVLLHILSPHFESTSEAPQKKKKGL